MISWHTEGPLPRAKTHIHVRMSKRQHRHWGFVLFPQSSPLYVTFIDARPFSLHLFGVVLSKGSMSDFTHRIISGNYEAVISTSSLPSPPLPQAHVLEAEALVSRWSALIPGDERLLLASLHWSPIGAGNCYIHAPRGNSMWRGGNSR